MNPFARFFDLIRNPSYSRTVSLLAILVVALSIPLTVFVAQQIQETRQQAAVKTQCEQNGGYCDGAVCAKFIKRCLFDTSVPVNCINPGASCRPGGSVNDPQNTGHFYECSELQPYSCTAPGLPDSSTPQIQDTCIPNGGTCAFNNLAACEIEKGSLIPGTCSSPGKICCKLPAPPEPQKCGGGAGTCMTSSACSQVNGSVIGSLGSGCISGICCSIPSSPAPSPTSTTVKTPAPAIGRTTCSASNCSLTAGKVCQNNNCIDRTAQKACATTPTCPTGFSAMQFAGKYACVNNLRPESNTGIEPACPTSTQAGSGTCNVAPFTIGSCTQADRDKQLKDGLAIHGPCKRVCQAGTARAGQEVDGISYKECQSNFCWYDSLYDPSPAKIEEGKDPKYGPGWCYGIPGQPDPCTIAPSSVASGNTQIAFTIGLDGLGRTGDFQSRRAGRNDGVTPSRNQRGTFFIQVFDPRVLDANGLPQEVANNTGKSHKVNYNAQTGKFTTTVDLGKTLTGGTYTVKVRVEGYLAKIVENISVTTGQTANVSADLITGDVVREGESKNRLDILDHNFITSATCFGKAATGACLDADLDDNGTVNEFDYNLFLREFTSGQREGDQFVAKGQ